MSFNRIIAAIILHVFAASGYGMSTAEAVFRCQASINKSEEIAKSLNNVTLENIAKVALTQMKKILDTLSKSRSQKDLPSVAMLCIKHAEHITWLKDSIAPNMAEVKSVETKPALAAPPAVISETIKEPQVKNKKLKKKDSPKRKQMNIKQRAFNERDLEEMLKNGVAPHKESQKTSTPVL